MPKVLWSLRTTTTRPTGFTPFRLLFSEEAMTSEECKNKSFHVTAETAQNEELLTKDAPEKIRMQVVENLASTKRKQKD